MPTAQIDPWDIYDYDDNYLITDPRSLPASDDPYDLKYQTAGSNAQPQVASRCMAAYRPDEIVDSVIPNAKSRDWYFGILRPVSPGAEYAT